MITELLVRVDESGQFIAAHIRGADGVARGVVAGQLPEIFTELNATAAARCAALEAAAGAAQEAHDAALAALRDTHIAAMQALQAEYDSFKSDVTAAAEQARRTLDDPDIDDARTVATVSGIVRQVLTPVRDREIAAAEKAAADALATLERLRTI